MISYNIGKIRITSFLFGLKKGERKVINLLAEEHLSLRLKTEVEKYLESMIPNLTNKGDYQIRIKGNALELGALGTSHTCELSENVRPHLTEKEMTLIRMVTHGRFQFQLGLESQVEAWRNKFFGEGHNTTPHEE